MFGNLVLKSNIKYLEMTPIYNIIKANNVDREQLLKIKLQPPPHFIRKLRRKLSPLVKLYNVTYYGEYQNVIKRTSLLQFFIKVHTTGIDSILIN